MTGGELPDYKGSNLLVDDDFPNVKVVMADRDYDSNRIRNVITSCSDT
jgi:hypothetical protein